MNLKSDYVTESGMTPAVLATALERHGLAAHLDDDTIVVSEPGPKLVATISGEQHKIFYSAFARFKPGLTRKRRLKFANKANRAIVGAVWVNKNSLRCSGWMSFEGGILMSNVVTLLREFRVIFDAIVLEMGNDVLTVEARRTASPMEKSGAADQNMSSSQVH